MSRLPSISAIVTSLLLVALPLQARAWGYKGHQIIADIARPDLTPAARARVDAILATDSDPLTAHDMASEATWADAYRGAGHRETASWHFVDLELDGGDLRSGCFSFPASPDGSASTGPANDCLVDKLEEFAAELKAPNTSPAERLLALKFVLHFVGDIHQPLHASDNHDRGGNCVSVSLGGSRTTNLHAYWDTGVLAALGDDPAAVAARLRAQITPAQRATWAAGLPRSWADESYQVAKSMTYTIGSPPGCDSDRAPIALPTGYPEKALAAAEVQLERAGVRLATILNASLG